MKSIVYIGGGYCGLTGAVHFAKAGVETIIYDLDQKVVDNLNAGHPKSGEFLRYLDSDIIELVKSGFLRATSDWDEIKNNDTFIIAVPSEKDGEPYDFIVRDMAEKILSISRDVPPIIIIESTLSPGVGNDIVEKAKESNLEVGKDYYLAICPRKDWFADEEKSVATLPRVVGGVTDECSRKVCNILSIVSKDIHVTDHETAELTKALENAFLHVPCMFAHELALSLPHLDVSEALRLASLHWRIPTYYLSFGPGGRCIPLATRYLYRASAGSSHPLSIAKEVIKQDTIMRQTIANIAEQEWTNRGEEGSILVLGLGYRPDFKDTGLSSGLQIAQMLSRRQHLPVIVHDPLFTPEEVKSQFSLNMIPLDNLDWGSIKIILLATPHSSYLTLPLLVAWKSGQYILDAQGQWRQYTDQFVNRGVEYHIVGGKNWYKQNIMI
jgi:UDP-N-acetyl-D-glucosamine dehydrogenase